MTTAVIVVLVLLVAFMLFGVPVGFAIGGATMAAMWFCSDLNMVVNAQYCYSGIFSFTVMAIPFFMLAGVIMSTGGIARRKITPGNADLDARIMRSHLGKHQRDSVVKCNGTNNDHNDL